MDKIFKSRTVWSILALFAFSGLQAVKPVVPPHYAVVVEGALAFLGAYCRSHPVQQF